MKLMFARHQVKAEQRAEHEKAIRAIERELREKAPDGVRSLVLKLDDGSYLFFLGFEGSSEPFFALDSFRAFQSAGKDRLLEPPQRHDAEIVYQHRMLAP